MPRILIVFLLLMVSGRCVQAGRDIEFNVDLFCGWDGYYRPMEWTPTEIGISTNLTEPFEGIFTLSAQQDGLNTLNIIHPIVLTPNQPLALPLATKLDFHVGTCTLTIQDGRRRTRWEQKIDMWDFSAASRLLTVVHDQDLLVGLVGRPQFGLLQLKEDTVCMSPRGVGAVCVGTKVPRMMPWDWTGFASLDLLVLYDPDWTLLRAQQVKAVCDWVSNGGTLLLVLGQHPLPQDSPLASLIPFKVGDLRTCEIAPEVLGQWGLDASQPETVPAWSLSPKAGAVLWNRVQASDTGDLYGAGYAGFGRVAVLGLDPSGLRTEQTQRTAEFWTRQITTCLDARPDAASSLPTPYGNQAGTGCRRTIMLKALAPSDTSQRRLDENRMRIGIAQDASNRVMEYLYQLRQMRPVSIWWIILTLSALAILLGPVDYLVLKRLDKLPYTWLTSTGWILIFTVGAYYGVQYLRGGTMQLRAVSVLDGIADSNCAWATYYAGLFAPRSDDYRLEGLKADQWWAGISPNREEIWAYRREAAMRQIYCIQQDGANLPVSLPINIWTVQSLLGEAPLDHTPFVAKVHRKEPWASVEITNLSDSPITSGFVLSADAYVDLGPVPARSTQTFDVRTRPFNAWGDSVRSDGRPTRILGTLVGISTPRYPGSLGQEAQSAFLAQGCLARTLVMHDYLRHGAALVCVAFDQAPAPFAVKNRSYDVSHIQYARLLVLDRPR
ncbi:MAG: hypothetical protein JW955_11060 [Sedimentisphaerales bacterium]|nr:hypothetical protein [Sedimentisphaerales bacterium]